MAASGAGDEAPRAAAQCVVVGGHDAVKTSVVGQTVFTERVTTVQMSRRRRERRFQTQETAELTTRLGRLQFVVGRTAARLATVGHVVGGRVDASPHVRRTCRGAAHPRSRLRRRQVVAVVAGRERSSATSRTELVVDGASAHLPHTHNSAVYQVTPASQVIINPVL